MVRFFEWLDDAFSHITGPALLLSLVFGSVAYFGGWLPYPAVFVGTAAGIAVDVIFWLQQRRVRAAYGVLARTSLKDAKRDVIVRQFRVQVAMMVFTGLVSCYTSNLFLFTYWHPTTTVLPVWLQTVVRGCLIPVLLWITSSLVPLTEDASAYLTRNATAILRKTLKETLRQINRRLKTARKRGANLVPVSVALMTDIGDADGARRLRLISEGISEAEGDTGPTYAAPFFTDQPAWGPPSGGFPPPMPPDGDYTAPQPLYPRPRPKARTAEEARAEAEAIVRNLLAIDPDMARTEIMRRGHISMGDTDFWRARIRQEMGIESKRRGKPQRHRRAS